MTISSRFRRNCWRRCGSGGRCRGRDRAAKHRRSLNETVVQGVAPERIEAAERLTVMWQEETHAVLVLTERRQILGAEEAGVAAHQDPLSDSLTLEQALDTRSAVDYQKG